MPHALSESSLTILVDTFISRFILTLPPGLTASGPKLNYTEYCEEIAQHRFILSPNGDRPECYQMYEAIGMGTVPITEMSSSLYRHLLPAPVLYAMLNWNLRETMAVKRLGVASPPTVNRMLV